MADRYKHIREAQQSTALSETVNVVGMPEFDGLLDHIYEYGTAPEGVIEKANAFARAVIARYAPKKPAVHPAITHCDNCGCDWLDNGLNPIGCPYCKQHAAASIQAEIKALRAEVERLRGIVRPKQEDECLTPDHWRMRAYYLEENWFRCSRACAIEQDKREQAEERAERLAEALRDAATSMQTIADKAGRDEYLMTMDQVRGYANNRADAARAALDQEGRNS